MGRPRLQPFRSGLLIEIRIINFINDSILIWQKRVFNHVRLIEIIGIWYWIAKSTGGESHFDLI